MPLLPKARLRLPGRRFLVSSTTGTGPTVAGQRRWIYIPYGRRFLAKVPKVHAGRPMRWVAGRIPVGRRFFASGRLPPSTAEQQQAKKRKPFYARWTTFFPAIAVVAFIANYIANSNEARQGKVVSTIDGTDIDFEPVRVKGGWSVHVMHTLPLRGLSRLWGFVNSIPIPPPLRDPSLRVYATIFGCNLEEIDPPNLDAYPSLGSFFSRRLKPGARPVDDTSDVVSPADGLLVNFGVIERGNRVEQVKGMSYSLDALLGIEREDGAKVVEARLGEKGDTLDEREFARINGIEYSLEELVGLGEEGARDSQSHKAGDEGDASVDREGDMKEIQHDLGVAAEMGVRASLSSSSTSLSSSEEDTDKTDQEVSGRPKPKRRASTISETLIRPGNKLHFAVIYLAPGDYHRYHSPVAWVVEKRRHFVGELFSVSPWMAKRLENLFVLNERVSLLGRWRNGFFSMTPVGATNVGSIRINFDQDLRTNTYVRRRDRPRPDPGTYLEATYANASKVLGGQPLAKGEEMGGFLLGSTIVLVFEAPKEFEWTVEKGDYVKVGRGLGTVKPSFL